MPADTLHWHPHHNLVPDDNVQAQLFFSHGVQVHVSGKALRLGQGGHACNARMSSGLVSVIAPMMPHSARPSHVPVPPAGGARSCASHGAVSGQKSCSSLPLSMPARSGQMHDAAGLHARKLQVTTCGVWCASSITGMPASNNSSVSAQLRGLQAMHACGQLGGEQRRRRERGEQALAPLWRKAHGVVIPAPTAAQALPQCAALARTPCSRAEPRAVAACETCSTSSARSPASRPAP